MVSFDPGASVKYGLKAQFKGEWPRSGLYGSLYLVARDRICGGCNSGWMSLLQRQAGPVVGRLIAGNRVGLAEDALTTVAGWLVMMAMVLDSVSTDRASWYFTQQERSRLRTHYEIPATSTFWLGYLAVDWGHLSTVCFGSGIKFEFVSFKPPGFLKVDSHVVTLSIFHAVFQVLIYRLPVGVTDPGFSLKRSVEEPWADWTIRFGPPDSPLYWPPPSSMDDLSLRAFARRWTPKTNPVEAATPEKREG